MRDDKFISDMHAFLSLKFIIIDGPILTWVPLELRSVIAIIDLNIAEIELKRT